jgi:hypothetical protein
MLAKTRNSVETRRRHQCFLWDPGRLIYEFSKLLPGQQSRIHLLPANDGTLLMLGLRENVTAG